MAVSTTEAVRRSSLRLESACWADVFRYPFPGQRERLEECARLLAGASAESADCLNRFLEQTAAMDLAGLEELYIKTFDMNPLSSLDLGWQLFGEEYNRGLYLAKLRRLLQQYGIAEAGELPDHLTHAAALLGRMSHEEALEFAQACVVPGLGKILRGLKEACPYRCIVEAVMRWIEARFGPITTEACNG